MIEVSGLLEVGEILVISEDLDCSRRSQQIMSPSIQCFHHHKQLLIINIIVVLSGSKHLGEIDTGMPCPIYITLQENGMLGGICGDGEGGREIRELKDWLGCEGEFQCVECIIAGFLSQDQGCVFFVRSKRGWVVSE